MDYLITAEFIGQDESVTRAVALVDQKVFNSFVNGTLGKTELLKETEFFNPKKTSYPSKKLTHKISLGKNGMVSVDDIVDHVSNMEGPCKKIK